MGPWGAQRASIRAALKMVADYYCVVLGGSAAGSLLAIGSRLGQIGSSDYRAALPGLRSFPGSKMGPEVYLTKGCSHILVVSN